MTPTIPSSGRPASWGSWIARVCLLVVLGGAPTARAEDQGAFKAAWESIRVPDLRKHLVFLADDSLEGREAGSRGGHAAGNYLGYEFQRHRLAGGGYKGGYYQAFDANYRNILGLLEGSDPELKQEVVVVSAHYDHVGYGNQTNSNGPIGYIHNGADDNASGTCGLLEVIEALTQLPVAPKRTLLFALWDGEEKGLLGSKHWVENPTLDFRRVKFMVNADMIGRLRNQRVEITGVRTGSGLRELLSRQNLDTRLHLDFTWEIKDNSDHHPFFAKQVPILMLHTGLHDDYHTPRDDVEGIDVGGMQLTSRLMFGLVHQLANAPQLPQFRSSSQRETVDVQKLVERTLPPLPGRLGLSWDEHDTAAPGLRVTRVLPDSAAAQAGIRVGDRVVSVAGHAVESGPQFRSLILLARSPAQLGVVRAAEQAAEQVECPLAGSPIRLGITWREDAAEPNCVILTRVVPGSPAAEAGLQSGDRVLEVDEQRFVTGAEFQALVTSLSGQAHLLVERLGRIDTVALNVPQELDNVAAAQRTPATETLELRLVR